MTAQVGDVAFLGDVAFPQAEVHADPFRHVHGLTAGVMGFIDAFVRGAPSHH
jgi:hypothetical protein